MAGELGLRQGARSQLSLGFQPSVGIPPPSQASPTRGGWFRVCVREQHRAFFKKKNVTKDSYGMRSDPALSLVNYSLASLWRFEPLAGSGYSFVVPCF